MAEIKALKQDLVNKLREGELTPKQAVAKLEAITPGQMRTGRVYEQKDRDARIDQYRNSKSIRKEIRRNRIPFISRNFLPGLFLSQGLIVVGAKAGRAKSTTASNVLAGFLQTVPEKSAIVVSNEEATDAVYERTACVLLQIPYTQFFNGDLSPKEERTVEECVQDLIIPRVVVVEDGSYDMSYLDDVQAVLETAAIERTGLVIIDYLQCITQSRSRPELESFQISKILGFYLKEYGKKNGVPVVCFAQLRDTDGVDMKERVENDKTIVNHAFLAIELIPDFETLTTKFKVHKDRFSGHTGKEVICDFKGGRYVFQGDDSL
jgi:hypothetical protein